MLRFKKQAMPSSSSTDNLASATHHEEDPVKDTK